MAVPKLPPTTLLLRLPALRTDQVDAVVRVLDDLNALLWAAYGDALLDLEADRLAAERDTAALDDLDESSPS